MTENISLNGGAFLPGFDMKFIGFICFIKGLLMAQHIDQSSHFVCTWLETEWVLPWDLDKLLLFQFSHP